MAKLYFNMKNRGEPVATGTPLDIYSLGGVLGGPDQYTVELDIGEHFPTTEEADAYFERFMS